MESQNPSPGLTTAPRTAFLRKESDQSSSMMYGRVQPQAVTLEETVLGAIMIDKDALAIVLDILQPDSFYVPAHQEIYRVMQGLFEKAVPIDLLTVHEALKKATLLEKIGGPAYLVQLTNRVASAANIEFHARIIAQKYIQRELIRVSTRVINDSFEDTIDVFQLLDEAEQNLFEITDRNLNRSYESLAALSVKAQKQIEQVSTKGDGMIGIPSGFRELDRMTSGWQKSDLIIVAARPGMGKTSFTLALARNAALDHKKAVALFSLEMSNIQLTQRLISMEAEISSGKLRNGQLEEQEWKQLHATIEKFSEVPIFIDDTPAINIFELRAKCRRLKLQYDIQLVIIDYLQLMSGGSEKRGGTREQEISTISRSLKSLAKELSIPVIALSQLSRAVETRGGNKRPQLSDLRESGAIEQDADIVTFIYRPDYYEMEDDINTPKGMTEIILAKHRNGALGTVQLKFVSQFAKFTNLDEFETDSFGSAGTQPFDMPSMFPQNNIITRPSRMNDDEEIPF